MQLNQKSTVAARSTRTLNTGLTQAEFIARQLLLERAIAKAAKCGTRTTPSIRKFSWED